MLPHLLLLGHREIVEHPLSNGTALNEDVIGAHLSVDVFAILLCFVVHVLITALAFQRFHVGHPEVVAESSDGMDGVLEGNLDLEAQGVEQNDILSTSSKVSAEKDQSSSVRMVDEDEADGLTGGFPQQIEYAISNLDLPFTVNRGSHHLEAI